MTEQAKDPLRSPSEATLRWLSSRRWHPVTWLVILAGLLHLVGDLVMSASLIARASAGASPDRPMADILAEVAHMIGLSLEYFGTAAIVEYLFRILKELRIRRAGMQTQAEVPPPSEL